MNMSDIHGRTAAERRELKAKVDEVNRDARENWERPEWRSAQAADMTETIYQGFEHENLLNLLAIVENVGWEDRVFVKEVRGLRAFWVARGGYIDASTLRADVMEIQRDIIGFHVYELEEKLKANFAETQTTLTELAIQRMDAEINLRVLRLFQAAIPSSSAYYTTGNFGLPWLNAALRSVRDVTRSNVVSIVGRATMTEQIIDELTTQGTNVGFTPETNEDILRRGILGVYRGARIVSLTNWLDDQDVPFFPGNELYVVGQDASKFAFWGELDSKEWVEQGGWYWHYMAKREFGGVVHRPDRLRRFVDNTLPA